MGGMTVRRMIPALALVAAMATVAGCAAGQKPTTTAPTAEPTVQPTESAPTAEAAWLDNGRMIGIVTSGSSTCIPSVDDVVAKGQEIAVALTEPTDKPCTMDFVPRVSLLAVPEGVDPAKDVTIMIAGDGSQVVVPGAAALTGTPGSPTDYAPSAGWFSGTGIALLTWGSSTCPPILGEVKAVDGGASVALSTTSEVCTMDMAPRGTVVTLDTAPAAHAGFALTLDGAGFTQQKVAIVGG